MLQKLVKHFIQPRLHQGLENDYQLGGLAIKLFCYMNKYETLSTIGEGEYGLVLKAINKETSELVAIKKFKEDDSQPENKRVILREVQILKKLNHENIIELKEAFRRKGKIYLVCEYVDKNLLEILEENTLTSARVKNLAFQMIKGIAYMHSQNIIHRDIKPENLLISKNDKLKICDLGFARTVPNNANMTDYVATRWYRPPQLLIGRQDYDMSIDIWSIGCVMAQMIDGEPLFGGQNDLDQLYLIQKCLGPLIANHKQYFLKNPKFVGMKFPEINAIESIDRRYNGKVDKLGLDLLKKMLRMDPAERISAQQALNHPYFSRLTTPFGESTKKSSLIQPKFHNEERETRDHSHNKANIVVNNFLQDKIMKNNSTREEKEKIGVNKVTGFSKIQKFPHNQSEEPQSPWIFNGKGKSLGKKNTGGNSMRDKQFLNSRARIFKERKCKNEDEEYADDWEQLDHQEQRKVYGYERSDRKNYFDLKNEEKSIENKKKKKFVGRKDNGNINIVFNQNTYNLNIMEDHYVP